MGMKMHNSVDIAIGHRVRKLRQLSGLTETDLASRLNIRADDLVQFEQGSRRIGSTLLDEMAFMFGVPVWSFFDRTTEDCGIDEFGDAASAIDEKITLH